MQSRFRLFGHSIHRQVVAFPVCLLIVSAVLDGVALVNGDPLVARVAGWFLGAGIVLALLAAPFGLLDLAHVPEDTRARRVGAMHGTGNTVALLLFIASWVLRERAGVGDGAGAAAGAGVAAAGQAVAAAVPTMAIVLSFAGAVLVVFTAWLGGELTSRLAIGVDEGAHPDAPNSLRSRVARPAVSVRRGASPAVGDTADRFDLPPGRG
jgi:uncharacterized membrane protein